MNYEVSAEQLQDVWPQVRGWIERAIEYGPGDENLADVFLGLARGFYSMWFVPGKWVAVYQAFRYPRQSVVTILYAGGEDLEAMKYSWDHAHLECIRRGIDVLRMHGRPGWERALGVKRVGVIMQTKVSAPAQKPAVQPELRTMQ